MVSKIEKLAIMEFLKAGKKISTEPNQTFYDSDPHDALYGIAFSAYEDPEWYANVLRHMEDLTLKQVVIELLKNYAHNYDARGNYDGRGHLFYKNRRDLKRHTFGDDRNKYQNLDNRYGDKTDVMSILEPKDDIIRIRGKKLLKPKPKRKVVKKVIKKCRCKK